MNVLCTSQCCSWEAQCKNGLRECPDLKLARDSASRGYGVVATCLIPAGDILGEYLGELDLVGAYAATRTVNAGYMLMMKARPEHPVGVRPYARVGIDAPKCGSLMRFLNHSCDPCAKFYDVANARRHTVVAVTIKDIPAHTEVTVDYGDDLEQVRYQERDGNKCRNYDVPAEASATRVKHAKAQQPSSDLKDDLNNAQAQSHNNTQDIVRVIVAMRQDAEAAANARRADDEALRRAEMLEQRQQHAEQTEMYRLRMEQQRVQDQERTQQLMMFMASLIRKPSE